jgi:hypothetical protein
VGKAKRAHHFFDVKWFQFLGGGHGAKSAFAHPTQLHASHGA